MVYVKHGNLSRKRSPGRVFVDENSVSPPDRYLFRRPFLVLPQRRNDEIVLSLRYCPDVALLPEDGDAEMFPRRLSVIR